jgi:hypothetical protein
MGILVTSSVRDEKISNWIVNFMVTDVEEDLALRGVHDSEMISDVHVVRHPSTVELLEAFLSS